MNKQLRRLTRQKMIPVGSVSDGKPFIKVMGIHAREGDAIFYFASNNSAQHTAHYLENPNACLYFYRAYRPPFFKGVMLEGRMEVCADQETKSRYWKPSMKGVYPGGETDPDYNILRFTAVKGRYYSRLNSEDFEI